MMPILPLSLIPVSELSRFLKKTQVVEARLKRQFREMAEAAVVETVFYFTLNACLRGCFARWCLGLGFLGGRGCCFHELVGNLFA